MRRTAATRHARRLVASGLALAGLVLVSRVSAADGDIDTTFGSDGFILLNSLMDHSPPIDTQAQSAVVDRLGRIVVAGAAQHLDAWGNHIDANFLLLRLSPDGSIDTSFASDDGGYRLLDFDLTGIGTPGRDSATDLAIQPDGKIVAIGNAYFSYTQSHFGAIRVDESGTADAAFGGTGMVHFGAYAASSNGANSVALDATGNILIAGYTSYPTFSTQSYAAVARLTPAGAIDPSFNSGLVQQIPLAPPADTALDSGAWSAGVDANGRSVVVGGFDTADISAAAVQRLGANGSLDSGFNNGAAVAMPAPFVVAFSTFVAGDGSSMVAGSGYDATGAYVCLAHLLADGTLDAAFGANGVASIPLGGFGRPSLIARTRRGGWLMAGPYAQTGVFIAKVLADGRPDTTLNGTGFATAFFQPSTLMDFVKPALLPDGKLVVVGTLPEAAANGVGTLGIMRVLADFDTLFVSGFEQLPTQ